MVALTEALGSSEMEFRVGRAAVMVCGSGLVLALLGCNPGSKAASGHVPGESKIAQTRVVGYAAYVKEFQDTVRALAWPAGFAKPTHPSNSDPSGMYQIGTGEGDAVSVFQCAWSGEYLKTRNTQEAKSAAALKMYESIKKMPAWDRSFNDPHTRQVLESAMSQAELGDGSALEQLYRANC